MKALFILFALVFLSCSKPFEPDYNVQVVTVDITNDDYFVYISQHAAVARVNIPELTESAINEGYTIKDFRFMNGMYLRWNGIPYIDDIGVEYSCNLYEGFADFIIYNGNARNSSTDILVEAVNNPIKLKLAIHEPN